MDEPMAAELLQRGGDPTGFVSSAVTAAAVQRADLVLTAEAAHRTRLLEDHPDAFRRIFTLGQFVEASSRAPADLRAHELIETVGQRRGNADPALDVQDPYQQGPEASARAAREIDDLVRAVVARLT